MKMSVKHLQGSWHYLSGDLTPQMIARTIKSYNTHVIEYAEGFEWDPDMQSRTSHDYLHSFIKYLKIGDHIFVVGTGTGRDALELHTRGFEVSCVDASIEMLDVAVQHGIRVPMWCQDIVDVCIPEKSLDGILAESVLQHVAKKNIESILRKMISWLRIDGVLYARVRMGEGRVFEVEDLVGTRYFTSYSTDELNVILHKLEDVEIVEEIKVVEHKVVGRPGFGSFILRKISK